MSPLLARLKQDRLARWSVYGAVPVLWLAIALASPVFLVFVPLLVLGLAACFRYGPLEREDPAAQEWSELS